MKKIFVSTGSLYPMERLLNAVDRFLIKNESYCCIAQTGASQFSSKRFESKAIFDEVEFREHFQSADFIVSHAGVGNILLAQELCKPIIITPRKHELAEHINNHQIATANGLEDKHFIYRLDDPDKGMCDAIAWAEGWQPEQEVSSERMQLIHGIRRSIEEYC